jgi:hypothetical protein
MRRYTTYVERDTPCTTTKTYTMYEKIQTVRRDTQCIMGDTVRKDTQCIKGTQYEGIHNVQSDTQYEWIHNVLY